MKSCRISVKNGVLLLAERGDVAGLIWLSCNTPTWSTITLGMRCFLSLCGIIRLIIIHLPPSSLNLTKLDVLDSMDEVKIGVSYKLNGKKLDSFPADLTVLGQVEVEYETLPGWKEDISKCKTFEGLPINAQKYVYRIEEIMDVKSKFFHDCV